MGSKLMPGGPMRSLTIVSALICIVFIYFLLWNLINGTSALTAETPIHHDSPTTDHHGSAGMSPVPEVETSPAHEEPHKGAGEGLPQPIPSPAYGSGPWSSPWSSWFLPESWRTDKAPERGGSIDADWNVFYHLGGDGPWVQKIQDVIEGSTIAPPEGCEVEQVHMLSRHAERYPTTGKGEQMKRIIDRLQTGQPKDDLAFLKDWTFFVTDPASQLDQLSSTGPYAGTVEAFSTGAKLKSRYPDLVSQVLSDPHKIKVWASDSERVIETARLVSLGLFGSNKSVDIQVISEGEERGGNTLTPTDTCVKYQQDPQSGHDLGMHMMAMWTTIYCRTVADRIEDQLYEDRKKKEESGEPMIVLSADDVFALQELCGFETVVRGQSPWCDVFTREEWIDFEYGRDVYHFYRSGPGNPYSASMGGLWLNATAQIIASQDPTVQDDPFFLSFTHDTSIVPLVNLLGLFDKDPTMYPDKLIERRKFLMSQFVPMGGRITLEKMSCGVSKSNTGSFVRLNINDGITEIPGCTDGPGSSCSVKSFSKFVEEKMGAVPSFKDKCQIADGLPEHIDFLKQ